MSTRAVYSFIDEYDTYHVYKHHDGYPSGAAGFLAATLPHAWKLPRFEPDEFATAFIAANKDGPGDLRLTTNWARHGDIEYRYEVRATNGALHITAYEIGTAEPIFVGSLEGLKTFSDVRKKSLNY